MAVFAKQLRVPRNASCDQQTYVLEPRLPPPVLMVSRSLRQLPVGEPQRTQVPRDESNRVRPTPSARHSPPPPDTSYEHPTTLREYPNARQCQPDPIGHPVASWAYGFQGTPQPHHISLDSFILTFRLALLPQPLQVAVDIERTIQHDDVILETETDSRTPSLRADASRKSVDALDVLKG